MADLKRYITEQTLEKGQTVIIDGAQYNHMINAMRHTTGENVILLNGDGYDYTAQIKEITKKSAQLVITEKQINNRTTRLKLNVYCGLLKGDGALEQAVKLSELGVYSFTPFISENCVVKPGSNKLERIIRVAEESSKQCKRAVPIKINPIINFNEALIQSQNCQIKIIAYEAEQKTPLKFALKDIEKVESAALFIGAEGGFTEQEISKAISSGFTPVTLGKTILKADTAAISAASAILYEAGEWSR